MHPFLSLEFARARANDLLAEAAAHRRFRTVAPVPGGRRRGMAALRRRSNRARHAAPAGRHTGARQAA